MISGPALATTMTPRPVRGHLTGYPGLDPPVSWGTDRSPQQPVCGPVLPPPGTRRGHMGVQFQVRCAHTGAAGRADTYGFRDAGFGRAVQTVHDDTPQ